MPRTTYDCTGCRMELATRDDLDKQDGVTAPSWRCPYCGTTVPSIVAERIKHQG